MGVRQCVRGEGALGKQAAARDVPSSSREQGGGFVSRHRCMKALWHTGSSLAPSPDRLREHTAPLPRGLLLELVLPPCQPSRLGQRAHDSPSGASDSGSSMSSASWPQGSLRSYCYGLPLGAGFLYIW